MSMYSSPPQPYGQYPHPMPPQVAPAVPFGYNAPAQSYYSLDPASFRRDYTSRLTELTVNSRPIIQGLSLYAQEYSRWADTVVECVEAHIRRVPPWMKLPAFYLIDAISKNVYNPYARFFASVVAPLFLDTYGQVDQQTRNKMEEMLLTWRTGAPGGRELFGVGPQVAIERGIWGTGSEASQHGSISKQQVLSELEFALNQKERSLQANPYDASLSSNVHVLQQLRKLIEAGVSQQELAQILSQLRTLVQPAPAVAAPIQPPQSYPGPSYNLPQPRILPQAGPSQPSLPESYRGYEHGPTFVQQALPPAPPAAIPAPAITTVTPAVPVPDVSSLFQSLIKSGILSNAGTPTGAGATVKSATPETDAKAVGNLEKEDVRAYRSAVLAEPVAFTSAEITRHRPNVDYFLYDRLSVQCGQCGVRFSDSVTGKKKMQDHLDEHFRANRKANQGTGRGHSRCLFVSIEDWLNDTLASRKGKGRADGTRRLSGKAVAAAEEAKRLADLRAQFVVIPSGDEAKAIACPVCKESLKAEFNEDDEEWVWRNATSVDDRIYHATCHAEAATSVSSLATRLLAGRSITPPDGSQGRPSSPRVKREKADSPALTSLSGVKRKAEPDVESSISVVGGTPPLKKMMLASAA